MSHTQHAEHHGAADYLVEAAPPPAAAHHGQHPAVPEGAHLMPSGNWVVLSDPKALTRGDKKNLVRAADAAENDLDRGYGLTEGLLARLVTAWSYPQPLPSQDPAAMDELPGIDDAALADLIADARTLLFPGRIEPADHADERSPTGPSGE